MYTKNEWEHHTSTISLYKNILSFRFYSTFINRTNPGDLAIIFISKLI